MVAGAFWRRALDTDVQKWANIAIFWAGKPAFFLFTNPSTIITVRQNTVAKTYDKIHMLQKNLNAMLGLYWSAYTAVRIL